MQKRTQKSPKNLFLLSFLLFLISFLIFNVNIAKAVEPEVKIKDENYAAKLVFQSEKDPITIEAGKNKTIVLKFKNIGKATWDGDGTRFISAYTMEPRGRASIFENDTWNNAGQTEQIYEKVKPGGIGELRIILKAPKVPGEYLEKFYLAAENYSWVKDGYFFLKIKVVSTNVSDTNNTNKMASPTDSVSTDITDILIVSSTVSTTLEINSSTEKIVSATPEIPRLSEEPRIRAGIWKPDDFVQFKSHEDDYNIYDGTTLMGVLPKEYLGVMKFRDGQYNFKGGEMEFSTDNYIRLSPVNDARAVFELLNFQHQVKWRGGSRNFNQYRGALEYRFSDDGKNQAYIINDLLFEDYMRGIGEASDQAPFEYIKALMVAARTYAYYTKEETTKHDKRNFDVSATTGDQLYLGYINEQISPNTVEAVSFTRGQMITYNDEIVITPYFGHSNGKTRAYSAVWGGLTKPWLVPVKCKYDKGLKRYGHGVGMSQRDAALRADKDKWDYLQIDKYYYTGTEVSLMYE
jgi:hypothetical protein